MKEETAIALPASDANNIPANETSSSDDCSTDEMTESLQSFENFFMRKLDISTASNVVKKIEEIVNVNEDDENLENNDKQLIAVGDAKSSSSMQPQLGFFLPLPVELLRKRVKR